MRKVLFVTILLGFYINLYSQCDNTKPMYGKGCIKSQDLINTDNEFVKTTVAQFQTKDSAALIYLRYGFRYLIGQNDPITSIRRFNQSWLLNPDNPNIFFVFGLFTEFILSKDAEQSKEYYETGRNLDKENKAEINTYSAFLDYFERKGDTSTIIKICDRAISANPTALNGYFYKKRGYYYLQMQRFKQSEDDLNKAISIDPKDANTYYNKASIYTAQKRIEEAKTLNLKVLEIDDKNMSALAWLFHYYWDDKKVADTALVIIDRINKIQEIPQAYTRKSEILFSQNKNSEACDCLKKSIDLGLKENKKIYKQKCK